MPAEHARGLVDTNVLILRGRLAPEVLPAELAVSAISTAELSAGVHLVLGDDASAHAERSRRMEILQWVEHEFDPIPFGAEAARVYGRLCAALAGIGRTPRRRTADLMIASVAAVEALPLFITNPDDFTGLADIVEMVVVPHPDSH